MSDKSKDFTSALEILQTGALVMQERATTRDDAATAERSMAACVDAFNAMYDTSLSETQGWMFMVFLKAARARQGDTNLDDYVDGSAYFALAGESAQTKPTHPT